MTPPEACGRRRETNLRAVVNAVFYIPQSNRQSRCLLETFHRVSRRSGNRQRERWIAGSSRELIRLGRTENSGVVDESEWAGA